MLAACREHPAVLAAPAPSLTLEGIENGLLIFQAIAYVPSPRAAGGVRSDLLFAMLDRLNAARLPLAPWPPAPVPGPTPGRHRAAVRGDLIGRFPSRLGAALAPECRRPGAFTPLLFKGVKVLPDDLLPRALAGLRHAISEPEQAMATFSVVLAMALVLVSSFVRTMIPLRWLAVGSSVGFVVYGALHPTIPTLLLNAVLLPINIHRALEMIRLTRQVAAMSGENELSGVWLRPYMHSARVKAGTILFRQGDRAERLYLLASGQVELVEIGKTLEPGIIFGEIAFFAPNRRRLLTARCVGECTVLSIDESTVKQLYYQNPAFGFELVGLIASRLSADVERLQHQIVDQSTRPAGRPATLTPSA